MDYDLIIVRYGEIGVKSPKVRRRFENKLISNIKRKLKCEIDINQGRVFLYPENFNEACEVLSKTMGVVSFSPAVSTETDFNIIEETVNEYVENLISEGSFSKENSFAIRCRRVGTHEFSSHEMAGFCGSVVVKATGAPVNLSNPDFELFVEVRDNKTYIYHEKIQGIGGLPIGTQGKVIALLSGGIDSPVAAFLMMKRGVEVIALHFNNYPYTGKSNEKVLKIVDKLNEYSPTPIKFYAAGYGEYLKKCIEDAPIRLTCVLCKSGMYRIAEEIAEKEGALAIVDGSSLGQVASQTLPNILATRYPTSMPVLSPLIGMDKIEIEEIGKKIGTLDISILPAPECTAVPQYPETNAKLDKVIEVLEEIDFDAEVKKIVSSLEDGES
ncbi:MULTISPECIES: tRNA uracil 4-sulfurtransferase ThiI [Methanobacterium]|jgi:thiamine biosynthesis protein ThiI|uniref:Probable tRNA sulfurtransferase n=1 Tax=Methanobacterium veterum TaxID=408577 RepID=A0A9E5DKS0_9EURY|nr:MULTISPECIES: tRNA uracil 4-sulfurtransferase ThiI [Methanobacterium]MCZ3365084.1 tRNA 4-thiouridine(8) synthase ThiI [Methanobacterium veterum]MCZ3372839.1 tRNA 4-thiouridine(8) synthase ThiI [Methanobacterium veterum]